MDARFAPRGPTLNGTRHLIPAILGVVAAVALLAAAAMANPQDGRGADPLRSSVCVDAAGQGKGPVCGEIASAPLLGP